MKNFPSELLSGYRDFRAGRYNERKEAYLELAAKGQKPTSMIIGCCDSRSAPDTIFNSGPGELFVVRNVANLVPPFQTSDGFFSTSAAIEFAVQSLKVQNIVVMGHGRCGGIQAALDNEMEPLSSGNFIGKWVELLKPVADEVNQKTYDSAAQRQTALEYAGIIHSIKNLRTFPFVAKAEQEGGLILHGAWFDISLGELWVLDHASGEFGLIV